MEPIISIIVPVYNVEKFLTKSINSLLNQTFKDIEIILVNDGSSDNSRSVCLYYESLDSRIIYVEQENKGVSATRNTGLKIAKGTYIGFIDPDDWVEPTMFEKMYENIIKHNTDMVFCDFTIFYNEQNTKIIQINEQKDILEQKDIINYLIPNMIAPTDLNSNGYVIMGSVWRILFKRSFVVNSNLQFKEDLKYMEDLIFVLSGLTHTSKISLVKEPLYNYFQRDGSAIYSYRNSLRQENIHIFNLIEKTIEPLMFTSEIQKRMKYRYIEMSINSIKNEFYREDLLLSKESKQTIKEILSDSKLQSFLSEISMDGYTFRKKFIISAIKKVRVLKVIGYYWLLTIVQKIKMRKRRI